MNHSTPGLPGAQLVTNPPAMQETLVQSLGWEDPLEEGRATHSSILAWRILWTEEPGGLLSMRSPRVRHKLSDLACMNALEKEMVTAPVILPGESQRQRSLVGCRLWGCTESDTTEGT